MSKAEFANVSECTPAFQYEMPVKPETHSISDPPPSEGICTAGLPSQCEDLPRAGTSKSESSLGSDESSTLDGTSTPEAFLGLQEPPTLELPSVPEVEAKSKDFLEELSQAALLGEEPSLQGEEPQLVPLERLPGLHDPFADMEAKLARLSSTMALADAPQTDVPKVPMQVADAMQDAGREFSRRSSARRRGHWAHRDGQLQLWLRPHLGGGSGLWPAQGLPFRGLGKTGFVSRSVNR